MRNFILLIPRLIYFGSQILRGLFDPKIPLKIKLVIILGLLYVIAPNDILKDLMIATSGKPRKLVKKISKAQYTMHFMEDRYGRRAMFYNYKGVEIKKDDCVLLKATIAEHRYDRYNNKTI